MNPFKQSISNLVWETKYRYCLGGRMIDQQLEDTWHRVAAAIAAVEPPSQQQYWQQKFYQILENFKFLPGGRILAGAGTHHHVTLLNCFVMPIKNDSLHAIFDALGEAASTLQQGGGVGYDFSILRPHGDLAAKTGVPASGPVSFMRIWDAMCAVLLSTGRRRGAMMGVLRCDHPDIVSFIEAKKEKGELRHFNISVLISDAFMQAVKADADWPLVFPVGMPQEQDEVVMRRLGDAKEPVACRVYCRIKARKLWDQIIQSAYDVAEPGVLFEDTINRMNPLCASETIHATNPCGEIPLPSYGACDLGAINLTQFVRAPFSKKAEMDWLGLEETTMIATRFLDNVIDAAKYPLPAQHKYAHQTRRIGLGMTGLADALCMLNLPYASQAGVALAAEIMQRIRDVTWATSIGLAQEKGAFPMYSEEYLKSPFVETLSEPIRKQLQQHGVRNSHHNTIAPTGTISLLANNISNGIEPIFAPTFMRQLHDKKGELCDYAIHDYAYLLFQSDEKNKDKLPPAFETVQDLTPDAHLNMQAALQPFIDNAISKTINIPADFPFAALHDVYTKAYESGLKGCTIFRPNPVSGSVISLPGEPCCEV